MVVVGMNANQAVTIGRLASELSEHNYFQMQLKRDSQDMRDTIVRFYRVSEPGWIEYIINQNGDKFGGYTGGLD